MLKGGFLERQEDELRLRQAEKDRAPEHSKEFVELPGDLDGYMPRTEDQYEQVMRRLRKHARMVERFPGNLASPCASSKAQNYIHFFFLFEFNENI